MPRTPWFTFPPPTASPSPPRQVEAQPAPGPVATPPPLRRGRPRRIDVNAGDSVRSVSIRVVVTPAEAEAFARLAQLEGMSLSQWARLAIYRGSGIGPRDTGITEPLPLPVTPRRHRRTRDKTSSKP